MRRYQEYLVRKRFYSPLLISIVLQVGAAVDFARRYLTTTEAL
jgi:hypothetical protein